MKSEAEQNHAAIQLKELVGDAFIDRAVDAFAAEMRAKLKAKFAERGNNFGFLPANRETIFALLAEHVRKAPMVAGQEVDVANLALMLRHSRMETEAVQATLILSGMDV